MDYAFDLANATSLAGAHGEEIVRDLFTDVHVSAVPPLSLLQLHIMSLTPNSQTHTTYTCGEDGQIRAWKISDSADVHEGDGAASVKKKRKEKKDKDKARFKPY